MENAGMNLIHLLQRQGPPVPDRPAIFEGERLGQLRRMAARSAGAGRRMRAAGLQPGDRVLLFARNHPRYRSAAVGRLVGRAGGGARQRQAAPARNRVDRGNAQARWPS
jgi:long-chain acyl-CoA synthetase